MPKETLNFTAASISLDDVVSDIKDSEGNPKKYSDLGVGEFFEAIKGLKQTVTDEALKEQLAVAEKLLRKYKITGQKRGAEMIQFFIDAFRKERKLVELGITDYVMCSDVNLYQASTESKRHLVLDSIENFEREIPDDIVDKIEACDGIFDQLVILYTDYTENKKSRSKTKSGKKRNDIIMERDPILFGLFGKWTDDGECMYALPRMYVIGDWIDEMCDLTLSKMISEYRKIASNPMPTYEVGAVSEDMAKDARALTESLVVVERSGE